MIHVVIVAAGSGTRFGGDVPKQFQNLNESPVVMWTIEAFRRAIPEADIKLVVSETMVSFWRELADRYDFMSPEVVVGGDSRFQSVKNALMAIDRDTVGEGDMILVHDGARPLVSSQVIVNVIEGTVRHGAVVPVVPLTDSIRKMNTDGSSEPVDRSAYRAVQTPQGFDASAIIKAYSCDAEPTFTDDASVAEAAGMTVALVDGDYRNIKITNRGDLEIARVLMTLAGE